MATLKNTIINDTGYLKLPVGTTAQRPASPQAGYMRYNTTESAYEVYDGNAWRKIEHKTTPLEIQYLIIAGGGSAPAISGTGLYSSSGAGSGGYRSSVIGESSGGGTTSESTISLQLSTNYPITIGAGASQSSCKGSNSIFSTITTLGGGGSYTEKDGGSGGGSWWNLSTIGSGTPGQGFNGGSHYNNQYSGGGGGAGQLGQNATSSLTGAGGTGVQSFITGTGVYRAGGGGAGYAASSNGGCGGGGSGSIGYNVRGNGYNGVANTGGGGGGVGISTSSGDMVYGGSGGSGVVILRYPNSVTLCIGAGLSATCLNCAVGSNERYTCIISGTGNICWI